MAQPNPSHPQPLVGRTPRTKLAGLGSFVFGLTLVGVVWYFFFRSAFFRPLFPWNVATKSVVAILAIGGLSRMVQGSRGLLVRSRLKRQELQHPGEPWFWSPFWDPAGSRAGVGRRLAKDFVGLTLMTLVLAAFHPSTHPILIAGDAIALVGWCFVGYRFVQGTKYGDSALRFGSFPFFLGEEAEVYLQEADRLRNFREMTWTLRCIEERVQGGGGKSEAKQTVCYVLYEEAQVLKPGDVELGTGAPARLFQLGRRKDEAAEMKMTFLLPAKKLATAIDPPRYWELEVKADIPGIDYSATFFLPVYSREGE